MCRVFVGAQFKVGILKSLEEFEEEEAARRCMLVPVRGVLWLCVVGFGRVQHYFGGSRVLKCQGDCCENTPGLQ